MAIQGHYCLYRYSYSYYCPSGYKTQSISWDSIKNTVFQPTTDGKLYFVIVGSDEQNYPVIDYKLFKDNYVIFDSYNGTIRSKMAITGDQFIYFNHFKAYNSHILFQNSKTPGGQVIAKFDSLTLLQGSNVTMPLYSALDSKDVTFDLKTAQLVLYKLYTVADRYLKIVEDYGISGMVFVDEGIELYHVNYTTPFLLTYQTFLSFKLQTFGLRSGNQAFVFGYGLNTAKTIPGSYKVEPPSDSNGIMSFYFDNSWEGVNVSFSDTVTVKDYKYGSVFHDGNSSIIPSSFIFPVGFSKEKLNQYGYCFVPTSYVVNPTTMKPWLALEYPLTSIYTFRENIDKKVIIMALQTSLNSKPTIYLKKLTNKNVHFRLSNVTSGNTIQFLNIDVSDGENSLNSIYIDSTNVNYTKNSFYSATIKTQSYSHINSWVSMPYNTKIWTDNLRIDSMNLDYFQYLSLNPLCSIYLPELRINYVALSPYEYSFSSSSTNYSISTSKFSLLELKSMISLQIAYDYYQSSELPSSLRLLLKSSTKASFVSSWNTPGVTMKQGVPKCFISTINGTATVDAISSIIPSDVFEFSSNISVIVPGFDGYYCITDSSVTCPGNFSRIVKFADAGQFLYQNNSKGEVNFYIKGSTKTKYPVFQMTNIKGKNIKFFTSNLSTTVEYAEFTLGYSSASFPSMDLSRINASFKSSTYAYLSINKLTQYNGAINTNSYISLNSSEIFSDINSYYSFQSALLTDTSTNRSFFIDAQDIIEKISFSSSGIVLGSSNKDYIINQAVYTNLKMFFDISTFSSTDLFPILYNGVEGGFLKKMPHFVFNQKISGLPPKIIFDEAWKRLSPILNASQSAGVIEYDSSYSNDIIIVSQSNEFPSNIFSYIRCNLNFNSSIGHYIVTTKWEYTSIADYTNIVHISQINSFGFIPAADNFVHLFIFNTGTQTSYPFIDSSALAGKSFLFETSQSIINNSYFGISLVNMVGKPDHIFIRNVKTMIKTSDSSTRIFEASQLSIQETQISLANTKVLLNPDTVLSCSISQYVKIRDRLIPGNNRKINIYSPVEFDNLLISSNSYSLKSNSITNIISVNSSQFKSMTMMIQTPKLYLNYSGSGNEVLDTIPSVFMINQKQLSEVVFNDNWFDNITIIDPNAKGQLYTDAVKGILYANSDNYPQHLFNSTLPFSFFPINAGRYCISLTNFDFCPSNYIRLLASPNTIINRNLFADVLDDSMSILIMGTDNGNRIILPSMNCSILVLNSIDNNINHIILNASNGLNINSVAFNNLNISVQGNANTWNNNNISFINCTVYSQSIGINCDIIKIENSKIVTNVLKIKSSIVKLDLDSYLAYSTFLESSYQLDLKVSELMSSITFNSEFHIVTTSNPYMISSQNLTKFRIFYFPPSIKKLKMSINSNCVFNVIANIIVNSYESQPILFDSSWDSFSSSVIGEKSQIKRYPDSSPLTIISQISTSYPNHLFTIDSSSTFIIQDKKKICLYSVSEDACSIDNYPIQFENGQRFSHSITGDSVTFCIFDTSKDNPLIWDPPTISSTNLSIFGEKQYIRMLHSYSLVLNTFSINGVFVNSSFSSITSSVMIINNNGSLELPVNSKVNTNALSCSFNALHKLISNIAVGSSIDLVLVSYSDISTCIQTIGLGDKSHILSSNGLSITINVSLFWRFRIRIDESSSDLNPLYIYPIDAINKVSLVPLIQATGNTKSYVKFSYKWDSEMLSTEAKGEIRALNTTELIVISEYDSYPSKIFQNSTSFTSQYNYSGFYCFYRTNNAKCPQNYIQNKITGKNVYNSLKPKWNGKYIIVTTDTSASYHPILAGALFESSDIQIVGQYSHIGLNSTINIQSLTISKSRVVSYMNSVNLDYLEAIDTEFINFKDVSVLEIKSDIYSSSYISKCLCSSQSIHWEVNAGTKLSNFIIGSQSFVLVQSGSSSPSAVINVEYLSELVIASSITTSTTVTFGFNSSQGSEINYLPIFVFNILSGQPRINIDDSWENKTINIQGSLLKMQGLSQSSLHVYSNYPSYPTNIFDFPSGTTFHTPEKGKYCMAPFDYLNECPTGYKQLSFKQNELLTTIFTENPESNHVEIIVCRSNYYTYPIISIKDLDGKNVLFTKYSSQSVQYVQLQEGTGIIINKLVLNGYHVSSSSESPIEMNELSLRYCSNLMDPNSLNPIKSVIVDTDSISQINVLSPISSGFSNAKRVVVFNGELSKFRIFNDNIGIEYDTNSIAYINSSSCNMLNVSTTSGKISVYYSGNDTGTISLLPNIFVCNQSSIIFDSSWYYCKASIIPSQNKGIFTGSNMQFKSLYPSWPSEFFVLPPAATVTVSNSGQYCLFKDQTSNECPDGYIQIEYNEDNVIERGLFPDSNNHLVLYVLKASYYNCPSLSPSSLSAINSIIIKGHEASTYIKFVLSSELESSEHLILDSLELKLTSKSPNINRVWSIKSISLNNSKITGDSYAKISSKKYMSDLSSANTFNDFVVADSESTLTIFENQCLKEIKLYSDCFYLRNCNYEYNTIVPSAFGNIVVNYSQEADMLEYKVYSLSETSFIPSLYAKSSNTTIFFDSSCYGNTECQTKGTISKSPTTLLKLSSEYHGPPQFVIAPPPGPNTIYDFVPIQTPHPTQSKDASGESGGDSNTGSKTPGFMNAVIVVGVIAVIGVVVFLVMKPKQDIIDEDSHEPVRSHLITL